MNSNLDEGQRRELAAMFLSKGWQLLKKELDERAKLAARAVIFGKDRETDEANRQYVRALESILSIEKGVFTPPEKEAVPPAAAPTDRYGVVQ